MKKQGAAFAALSVAGEFQAANGQVGDAPDFDGPAQKGGQCLAVALHDMAVGGRNGPQRRIALDSEGQRIIQAARPLQDRAAAAAPAEHADARLAASLQVRLARHLIGEAGDDKIGGRLPKAENIAADARVAGVEEGFITGQVGGRGGQSEVKIFHGVRR